MVLQISGHTFGEFCNVLATYKFKMSIRLCDNVLENDIL